MYDVFYVSIYHYIYIRGTTVCSILTITILLNKNKNKHKCECECNCKNNKKLVE